MKIAIGTILGAALPLFLIWYSGKDINMFERNFDNVWLLLLLVTCAFLGSALGAMFELWSEEDKRLHQ